MTDLFISVLNMSITASYVILAVLVVRFFLKNLPKKYSYLLWSVVGFRLVCPVSFKSIISLFSLKPFDMAMVQSGDTSSMDYIKSALTQTANNVSVGLPNTDSVIEDITSSYSYWANVDWVLLVLSSVWAIGIFSLVIYSAVKYICLRKRLNTAVLFNDNVYQAEGISSPFIIGLFKPKIYIPYNVSDDFLQYVLQHEKYHIKRCNNVIKIIAYLLLILHWFNPLCYLAFYTLKYVYSKFLQDNQKGLYADMYLSVLIEMLGDEAIKANPNNPQEYFNDFYSHIKTVFEKNDEDFVKANYPKSYVLLKMTVLNESKE